MDEPSKHSGFWQKSLLCVSSPSIQCVQTSQWTSTTFLLPQRTENMKECHGAHYGSDLEVDDIIMLTSHSPDLIHIVPRGCERLEKYRWAMCPAAKGNAFLHIKALPGIPSMWFSDINWTLTSGTRTSHIHYMHRVCFPDIVSMIPKALNYGRNVLYTHLYIVSSAWPLWMCDKSWFVPEGLPTLIIILRFLHWVNFMFKVGWTVIEWFSTLFTIKGLLSCVCPLMYIEGCLLAKCSPTFLTFIGFLPCMNPLMLKELWL